MSKILGRFVLSRSSRLQFVIQKSELRACHRLLHRSGFQTPIQILGLLRTSSLHTSSCIQSSSSGGPDKGSDQDNEDKDSERERMLSLYKTMVGFFLVPLVVLFLFGGGPGRQQASADRNRDVMPKTVTWNDFYYNMLLAGEVEEVVVHAGVKGQATVRLRPDAMYKGQLVMDNVFILAIPSTTVLEDRIREAEAKLGINPGEGVSVRYERHTENVSRIFFVLLVIGLLYALFKTGKNLRVMTSTANPFSKIGQADFTLVDPQIRMGKGVKFSDVAGLKEAKVEVKEFVDYLKHPDKYRVLGAKPPKGAILLGPPGCGKTMLAKAVANESNVPFLSMNGSEFIEMIGGVGAARVRSLFAEARKRSPAIVYIDEIDAIGRKRSGSSNPASGGGGEAEQTLNQLLVEMDGIASKEGVVMLASTNRPDVLDQALMRPGRFDRQITIDLPTVSERKDILEQHMKGVILDQEPSKYSERLATLTPGFSGADLANLVNEAALHAARLKYDKVKEDNLEYAIERVVAGPEKKTNVLRPQERKIVAYHESGHAIVGWMLKHTDALLKVTILPRTSQALGFAQYTPVDKKLYSPEEMLDRMCMALGGRVAESLTFNRITTGAQNDLEKVTKMAYAQIKYFGFNENVGLLSYEDQQGQVKPYSKRLQATMDHEARLLIAEAYRRTEALLTEHKASLKVMAERLLETETLNYSDVEALIGPPPHGKKHLVTPVDFENSINQQAQLGQGQPSEGQQTNEGQSDEGQR